VKACDSFFLKIHLLMTPKKKKKKVFLSLAQKTKHPILFCIGQFHAQSISITAKNKSYNGVVLESM
jgi:hypothetical protein